MCSEFLPLYLNSAGLVFDIIGAWLVAWEVVRQYEGKKSFFGYFPQKDKPKIYSPEVKDSPEYKAYESLKYTKMKWGLFFLTIGFALQILSNLLQIIFHQ